jgi:hypothetical protein
MSSAYEIRLMQETGIARIRKIEEELKLILIPHYEHRLLRAMPLPFEDRILLSRMYVLREIQRLVRETRAEVRHKLGLNIPS